MHLIALCDIALEKQEEERPANVLPKLQLPEHAKQPSKRLVSQTFIKG